MILANVNIGTGPSAGDGDPLRTAFTVINQNFTQIQSNVNALTNSVTTVAGRTGNVLLTTQDIIGINNYANVAYVDSKISANIATIVAGAPGALDTLNELANALGNNASFSTYITNSLTTLTSNDAVQSGAIASIQSDISTLTSNAASQAGSIASIQSDISTLTANAGAQAGSIASLVSNAAVQAGLIASLTGATSYSNSNVAAYLPTYAGNILVNTLIFDDLSEQHTAYTGTQWRSNLSSNVTVKPSWMSYYPGLKNQLGTQYGFDSNGMFFSGDADNDIAYPIRTNLHIHGEDTTEIIATINFANTNDDHGIAIFNSTSVPIWRYATDTTRIAFQFSSGTPRLYGQTTQHVSGTPILTAGNDYTIKFVYNPGNTVTVYTYDGPDTTGTLLDTRTINEVLPAGDYVIGFDADQDGVGNKSYFTNVIVRTLTDTVVNDLEVQGQVTGNLIPSSNVTYSLGNVTHQWKDLWVSNTTIYVGGVPISVDGGGNLLVNGAAISSTATNITSADDITITNASGGSNVADIYIESADDIFVQAKNRTIPGPIEGGDLNLYAGSGGLDDVAVGSGGGGDIQLYAGDGGAGNVNVGSFGGTISIVAGSGGAGSATARAGGGGGISITAGSAGSNNGGAGYTGGGVFITAGDSSDPTFDRGSIVLTSGQGGDETSVGGYVQINIPAVGTNPGGEWVFSGVGTVFEPPPNAEIFSPTSGNLTLGTVGNTIIRNITGATYDWVFGHTGILTFPDSTTQTTAWAGNIDTPSGYINFTASPAPGGSGITFADATTQTSAYSNVQVATYLSDYNGSINFTASPAIISGLGSITTTTANITANITTGGILTNNYYYANGTPVSFGSSYGNTEVESFITTFSGNVPQASVAYSVNISPVILNQEYHMAILPAKEGQYGVKAADGTANVTYNPVQNRLTIANIAATGSIQTSGVNGRIGYSSGGYVIQSGNSSGVSLNTISGNIKMDTVNIAASSAHTVALSNNKLEESDLILVQVLGTSGIDLHVGAYYVTTNTAIIYLRNISGSPVGPIAPMLKYAIIKAPSS